MIEWFEVPYKATHANGFEVLVHGLVVDPPNVPQVIIVTEEGTLGVAQLFEVTTEWRYTRERGWFGLGEPEE